ncbi:hypothetical protein [Yinghuangia seranimata]|uniref:hypothetical protein n=1 Tax=Yinghuangia seranimata TaxID=408067 RepID=UPI00248AD472|nr:hypothetical protein [Yinghuangia seranimata]MDI2125933.1 hypothetical protein [Yinghuangia seranimata]
MLMLGVAERAAEESQGVSGAWWVVLAAAWVFTLLAWRFLRYAKRRMPEMGPDEREFMERRVGPLRVVAAVFTIGAIGTTITLIRQA